MINLYLSSYGLGDKFKFVLEYFLKRGLPKRVLLITNALDYIVDKKRKKEKISRTVGSLESKGFYVETIDLAHYFGKKNELEVLMRNYSFIRVRGGNIFALNQSMILSGFHEIIISFLKEQREYLYGGYSAGACVLTTDLSPYELVDEPLSPCGELSVYKGLGLFDWILLPHYNSAHPESLMIHNLKVELMRNNLLFITISDGEVLILGAKITNEENTKVTTREINYK